MSNLEEVLSYLRGDIRTILNVGANNGQETAMFLDRFPACHVYSFEPEPRAITNFRHLIHNPRSTLIEKAVGAGDGNTIFYQSSGVHPDQPSAATPQGWDQSGSIRKPFFHLEAAPWVKFESTIEVSTIALDSWAKEANIDHVDLLWADVQGAEEDLIRGASLLLHKTRFFYTEYSNLEMYSGQICLEKMIASLPNFKLLKDYGGDAFFENICYD